MLVRLRAMYASPRGCFGPGTVIDLPSGEAEAIIAGGYGDRAEVEAQAKAASESEDSTHEVSDERPARSNAKKKA